MTMPCRVIILSDLAVETCFIGTLSIKSSRDSDNVLSFCLEPININSVLVVFRESLLQRSHLWVLLKSRFRLDCIECKSALEYVMWVSSAYILGWQNDKQFGKSFIYLFFIYLLPFNGTVNLYTKKKKKEKKSHKDNL